FVFMIRLLPRSTLFPYTTLFRSIGIMKGFFAMILGIGLAFGFGPAAGTATPSLQPETSSGFQFVADAYGTQATLGNVVVAGKTAVSSLGACGIVQPPVHDENTVL